MMRRQAASSMPVIGSLGGVCCWIRNCYGHTTTTCMRVWGPSRGLRTSPLAWTRNRAPSSHSLLHGRRPAGIIAQPMKRGPSSLLIHGCPHSRINCVEPIVKTKRLIQVRLDPAWLQGSGPAGTCRAFCCCVSPSTALFMPCTDAVTFVMRLGSLTKGF